MYYLLLLPLPFMYLNYKLDRNVANTHNRIDALELKVNDLLTRLHHLKIHIPEK